MIMFLMLQFDEKKSNVIARLVLIRFINMYSGLPLMCHPC